jgi:hypothetical protein
MSIYPISERGLQRKKALAHFELPDHVVEILSSHLARNLTETFLPVDRALLGSEPFVVNWLSLLHEASRTSVRQVLEETLFEFTFPVAEGMSSSLAHKALSMPSWGGSVPPRAPSENGGPAWESPDKWRLTLCNTAGGLLPVIEPVSRRDFVLMVQAIIHRNEPVPVPDSIGAFLVSGYTSRKIHREVRDALSHGTLASDARDPRLWSEKFLLLSSGRYSDVAAEDMGIEPEEWIRVSRLIRLEHEGCHYLVRRFYPRIVFGLQDELVADFAGLMAAFGEFRAAHFLRFMGIDDSGVARPAGRFAHYQRPLTENEDAKAAVGRLLVAAAKNVEAMFKTWDMARWLRQRHVVIPALTWLGLEEIAAPGFAKSYAKITAAVNDE